MKADVQYNDFIGTSAADISDYRNLIDYIKGKGVNTDVYKPIGAEFYAGGDSAFFSFCIICVFENRLVKLQSEEKSSFEDFIRLFKRFDVIVHQKHYNGSMELEDVPLYIEEIVEK